MNITTDHDKGQGFSELEMTTGDLAECGICGRNKPVCCDEGYTENEDGSIEHVGAVCRSCCGGHQGAKWAGKSVAGGSFEHGGY